MCLLLGFYCIYQSTLHSIVKSGFFTKMAGCSLSIRLTYFKNLKKEILFSRDMSIWNPNLTLLKFQDSSKVIKTKGQLLYKRNRQGLVIVNALNPETDPASGVAVTTVTKGSDGSHVEKDGSVLGSDFVFKGDKENGDGGGNLIDGSGGNGKFSGGGGGGGGGNGGGDDKEEELGPILKFEEVIRETEARGTTLPIDMLEAAKNVGIRKVLLLRYLDLQVKLSCTVCFMQEKPFASSVVYS